MDNQGGVLPGVTVTVTVTETSTGRQHVFGTVLPFENQQIGGDVGGPIVKDKVHRVSPASSPPT